MPNLWDVITGNSTLPVAPGTTLWDHLNNQAGGGEVDFTYLSTYPIIVAGTDMAVTPSTSQAVNAAIQLDLSNLPDMDDPQMFRALLYLHNAVEAVATKVNDFNSGAINLAANTSVVVAAANYQLLPEDGLVLLNSDTGLIAILTSATVGAGKEFVLKNIGAVAATITAVADETIDGSPAISLLPNKAVRLRSDGLNWWAV